MRRLDDSKVSVGGGEAGSTPNEKHTTAIQLHTVTYDISVAIHYIYIYIIFFFVLVKLQY